MVDASVDDIDDMGRKELQALAKNFGIKANQKSVVLRYRIREAMAMKDPSCPPNTHKEDEREQSGSSSDDVSGVCKDAKTAKNKTELHPRIVPETMDSASATKNDETDLASEESSGENEVHQAHSEESIPTVTTSETDDSVDTPQVGVSSSVDTPVQKVQDENEVAIEETAPMKNDDNEIDDAGKQTKEYIKPIESDPKISVSKDKAIRATKIPEKPSTKKSSHSKVTKNEKFASKLDGSFRKSNATKPATGTNLPSNLPRNDCNSSTKERSKASTVQKREVPAWKIHSTDFIRKRGPDKTRESHPETTKKELPQKQAQRRPFGTLSNNNVQTTSIAKKNGPKDDVRRIPPKPQAMSQRNEEQMKRFLERQSVGRQHRAQREEAKQYVNCVRS